MAVALLTAFAYFVGALAIALVLLVGVAMMLTVIVDKCKARSWHEKEKYIQVYLSELRLQFAGDYRALDPVLTDIMAVLNGEGYDIARIRRQIETATEHGAEVVCAEAYQLIGQIMNEYPDMIPYVSKWLDNLAQHKLVHKDLLPVTINAVA